jgi:predicted exporter
VSYRWRRRLFFLLLPLLIAAVFLTTRVETDLNTFFTATDREDAAFLAGFLQSGELSRRYLIAVEANPPDAAGTEAFGQTLAERLGELAAVERVWPADRPPEEWIAAVRSYAPYHARIYSLDPEAERERLFAPESLKARAEGLKQALLSPQGGFVKDIAKADPLLLSLQGFRGLQARFQSSAPGRNRAGGSENPLPPGEGRVRGTNKDSTPATLLILQSRPPSLDTEAQAQLQTAIRERFDALNAAAGGKFRLAMTGAPVFTVAAHGRISRDVALVSLVSSAGVVLVFLALFRSFAALHAVLLIVAAAYAVGTLATSLVFGSVHSLTLALGSTLTGVSIDYPTHVLAHAAQHRGAAVGLAVRRVWPSLFVGALTTVVGYAALGFTGFPGFRQTAVFSAANIAAALILTRWVLPALLAGTELRPRRLRGLSGWIDFCRRRRGALLTLSAAGLVGAAALLPGTLWLDDLQNLTMDLTALRQNDRDIRARFAGIEPGRFVLVKAQDLETALQRSEAAERRLRQLKADGGVSEFHGLYPWLVSAQLQARNAAGYTEALAAGFEAPWRAALAEAGLSVARLGTLAPAAEPLPPPSPDVRRILSGQIIEQPGGTALVIWLGAHDPEAVAGALEGLPGVQYFSQRDLLNGLARDYRDQSLRVLGLGLGAIYLLLWLRYRHAGKAFFSLLPALAAAVCLFAAWAVFREPVSFLHVMGLLLAVSICEDYGIFFLDDGGEDLHATYQAIAASMLTTAVSFAALGLAENPVLRIMAAAVTLGVVLGFLLCPLLIRSGGNGGAGRRGS